MPQLKSGPTSSRSGEKKKGEPAREKDFPLDGDSEPAFKESTCNNSYRQIAIALDRLTRPILYISIVTSTLSDGFDLALWYW